MTANDLDLLGQFSRDHSQEAFTALVNRHLNLVYSAALRQVRSTQIAEEVSQTVFTTLARQAGSLQPRTILTAWLYQVTRNAAVDVVRREARRQAREQIAFQMSETNDPATDWKHLEPLLDDAMNSLEETDRTAILLRFFENKSLREVGEQLAISEDAAQKRVSRAVDNLRGYFSSRKIATTAGAIAAAVSAHAVQAAPAALFTSVTAGAMLASGTLSATTALSTAKIIAMTATQKIIIAVLAAGAIVAGVYQARQISSLHEQVSELNRQVADQASLSNQNELLRLERDSAKKQLAALSVAETARKNTNEVLKLRGEVGRLRRENSDLGGTSALSKITSDPKATKMLRDSQKMGMSMIYKDFAKQAGLTSEQTAALNDLLADHIMTNVNNVTAILHDKSSVAQMNQIFAGEDAALQGKLQELLGPDALAQYNDYTRNLLATLTAQQFKSMLTGTDAETAAKSQQLSQVLQEEVQKAVAAANLPADYQVLPILNFANIANEQTGEQSLQLVDGIYSNVATRAASFLSPADLAKFQEFRTTAIDNSRGALTMNRTMMAPISN
jgi:RNA polymerase sigma factor (sigma-70 family)